MARDVSEGFSMREHPDSDVGVACRACEPHVLLDAMEHDHEPTYQSPRARNRDLEVDDRALLRPVRELYGAGA